MKNDDEKQRRDFSAAEICHDERRIRNRKWLLLGRDAPWRKKTKTQDEPYAMTRIAVKKCNEEQRGVFSSDEIRREERRIFNRK